MVRPLPSLFSVALLFLASLLPAQTPASSTFQGNNVRAVVNANGALFTDIQGGQFVPVRPGLAEKTLLRGAGIWAASMDAGGNLRGAVVMDNQSDFSPGLLGNNVNHIWRVNRADINMHLADFQDNGQIDNPNSAVFAWPGLGNPNSGFNLPFTIQGLAGYEDSNDNGIYDPATGDYPSVDIRGCPINNYPEEMGWFVCNDLGNSQPHPSGLLPLNLEVQTQIFTYPAQASSSLPDNAIYVRYKLVNRGSETINSLYVGLFNDFSIGNAEDDFVGIDPERNLIYAYNGDGDDEGGFGSSVPVMALDLLYGPLDTFGNEIGFQHFVALENTNGLQDFDFYNVLTGHFPDGTLAPNNGLMYPGNPNDAAETSEVSLGNIPGHRIGVGAFAPFSLHPGGVNIFYVAYYYVHTPGFTPLQNVQSLYDQNEPMAQLLFSGCFSSLDETNQEENGLGQPNSNLLIYPNPTTDNFTIQSKGEPFSQIHVSDMLGRRVQGIELDQPTQKHTIVTNGWPAGLYAVQVGEEVKMVAIRR